MIAPSLKSSLRPSIALLGLATAMFVGAAFWNITQQRALREIESSVPATAANRAVPLAEEDFVQTLPRRFEMQAQHRLVEGAGDHAGVVVRSLSMEIAAARADALGRLDCHVLATGSYARLKAFMAEVLSHSAAAHVQRASLRSVGNGSELELRLDWQLLSQPIQTGSEKLNG